MRTDYFSDLVPGVPGASPVYRGQDKRRHDGNVPGAPGVPGNEGGERLPDRAQRADENAREHYSERAAIAEHDAELPRKKAEQEATRRVYCYRVCGRGDHWLFMLAAPGEGIKEARASIESIFGQEYVVDVRPYSDLLEE